VYTTLTNPNVISGILLKKILNEMESYILAMGNGIGVGRDRQWRERLEAAGDTEHGGEDGINT